MSGSHKGRELKEEISLLIDIGQEAKALDLVSEAIEEDPTDWYLFYLRGWIFQRSRRAERALKNYLKADSLTTDNVQLKAIIGELFLSLGEYERSLPYLDAAVNEWPDSSEARSMYAIALIKMNDLEQAEVLLIESCQLNNANPDAIAKLTEVYLKTSRTELIEPLLETYIHEAEDLAAPYALMGEFMLLQRRDCEQACRYFEIAIKKYSESKNPNWFNQYFSTAEYPVSFIELYLDALIRCGYHKLALDVSKKHLEDPLSYVWKARVLSALGEPDAGLEQINMAIEMDDSEPGFRAEKASQLILKNQPREAEREIRLALEDSFGKGIHDPWYLGTLAVSLIEQNREEEAHNLLADMNDPELTRARVSVVHHLSKLQRWKDVIAWSNEILRESPNNTEVLLRLGRALVQIGEYEKALDIYQELMELQPSNASAQLEMAFALELAGDKSKAETLVDKLLTKNNLSQPQKIAAEDLLNRLQS